jgi:DNA polymerase-3 subunit epsilon/ATP-dependent DNA helicase DinG
VGPILRESLFERERSVVMTGATMSFEGKFDRMRRALGLDECEELVLGSPFNYEEAALIAVPEDIPEPGSPGHAGIAAQAIAEIARGAGERTLVLFTSHSALETARRAITPMLGQEGFTVIGQGNDGSPQRIMDMLAANPKTVALGTSSLWEGVDLQGTALDALVMARLPFPVPTEPIFAARSELYENGFNEYAIPEAVLRFRQGFGRLIRSKGDRGVFVVLDSRILTKRYGVMFQRALPKCTVRRTTVDELRLLASRWSDGEPV